MACTFFDCDMKTQVLFCIIFAAQVLSAPTNDGFEDKLADIKSRGASYLEKFKQNFKQDEKQSRMPGDPILEALIMDTAAFVTRTTEYLLNFQQTSASLRRIFGSDVPDYHLGGVVALLQDLQRVLYAAGATEQQVQELGIAMFKQKTWYRMDYHRSEFSRCWTLIGQLIEYLNTDYLVPYSTRSPSFLYAAGEEFFYSYMTLASYMSEQSDQSEILKELAEIESKAFKLGNMLGASITEIEYITTQLNDIFSSKFSDINFAMGKFYTAALDAHSAIQGVVWRYNELTNPKITL